MSKLRIAITGVTGLIGRNLLFEIIKQNLHDLDNLEIFVLGRSFQNKEIGERIASIVENDGLEYISDKKNDQRMVLSKLNDFVKCLHVDLEKNKLDLSREDFNALAKNHINIFYHVGASTDLRLGQVVEQKLREVNVNGTLQILELVASLNVGEFCYVGTAYSCGNVSGTVLPDTINLGQQFRNPYEKTKLEAEILVRQFAKRSKMKFRYFRPSVTCGRLIEKPLGAINKFDVFYGWGAFFLAMKKKMMALSGDNLYKEKMKLDIRICFNKEAGLNIVPADYVAKIMYMVPMQADASENFHVVNEEDAAHSLYLLKVVSSLNISGVRHVEKVPAQLNKLEEIYYKTAGKIFTPYINAKSMIFSVENLQPFLRKQKISCPRINNENLSVLMDYAKKYNFGIK